MACFEVLAIILAIRILAASCSPLMINLGNYNDVFYAFHSNELCTNEFRYMACIKLFSFPSYFFRFWSTESRFHSIDNYYIN